MPSRSKPGTIVRRLALIFARKFFVSEKTRDRFPHFSFVNVFVVISVNDSSLCTSAVVAYYFLARCNAGRIECIKCVKCIQCINCFFACNGAYLRERDATRHVIDRLEKNWYQRGKTELSSVPFVCFSRSRSRKLMSLRIIYSSGMLYIAIGP